MTELHPWRTFSIFISSTFADMQAERDYLKQIVFPRVEEELKKRRIKLEIVDLRWGLDTTSIVQEDEREASILKVCLDEIKRCRPFFIGLLGDRYGWVPSEERMKTALAGEKLALPQKGKSVTALEMEFGVLAGEEQLSRSVFYFREPLPYEKFSPGRASMFSDACNSEFNEAEIRERKLALEKLKRAIREYFEKKGLREKVKTYRGTWDESREKVSGLETWGEIVYEDILSACKSHAEETWDQVPRNWKEQELSLLDAFVEGHAAVFCGRNQLLTEIKGHLLSKQKGNWGMLLTGESGSGKSSVFAMVKKMMDREACFVLAHSAGLSHRAKSVRDLLLIWNTRLSDRLGIQEESTEKAELIEDFELNPKGTNEKAAKPEMEKIQERFRELLFAVAEKEQVVLLLDALDRFEASERARYLTWLPALMPGNIRMLCTALSRSEEKAVQYHNGLFVKDLDVFSMQESREMLNMLCKQQHKTLPRKVSTTILEKMRDDGQAAASSPLWLSLAVNMMMILDQDDFEKISRLEGRGDQKIENYMAGMALDFHPLPGPLFLSLVNKAAQVFGENFTRAVWNYLAISRNGLREKDLEKLLGTDHLEWSPLLYAELRRWFSAHLVLQGEELQWNLAHSILRTALIQKSSEAEYKGLHKNLATHFVNLVDDPLKATETLHHLLQAGMLNEAAYYYGGELTTDEASGATKVLAESITTENKGLETAASLPALLPQLEKVFHGLLKRYLYDLSNFLAIDGNLDSRLNLLNSFKSELDKTFGRNLPDSDFEFDVAILHGKLGEIQHALGHLEEALQYFDEAAGLLKELSVAHPRNEKFKSGLAVTFQGLGAVHQAMGHMEKALQYFEQRCKLGKELYEANPQSETLKHGLANSYSKLGSIHQAMGQLEEALKYFENYNQLEKERCETNPGNESLKEGLAYSYVRLGEVHQAMGHLNEALQNFDEVISLFRELYEAKPQDESFKHGLAISCEKLGAIHQAMGHKEKALKYFEERAGLAKELYEANPRNELLKDSMAISFEKLGEIHQALGHMEEALAYYEKHNQLEKELCEANPRNERLKISLAISYGRIGDFHQAMGHMEAALKYYEKVVILFKELYKSNPLNERLKIGLSTSYERLGTIHQALGHLQEALQYYQICNRLARELHEANPRNEALKDGLASSCLKLGDVHQAMGYMDEALEYFDEVVGIFKELCEANPRSERLKTGYVISCEKLGKIHQLMGHLEEALKHFETCLRLKKEFYEANPRNIHLLEGLGIAYYNLSMLCKEAGKDPLGRARFGQWRNIISMLVNTMPQVPKYQEWDRLEYD